MTGIVVLVAISTQRKVAKVAKIANCGGARSLGSLCMPGRGYPAAPLACVLGTKSGNRNAGDRLAARALLPWSLAD